MFLVNFRLSKVYVTNNNSLAFKLVDRKTIVENKKSMLGVNWSRAIVSDIVPNP